MTTSTPSASSGKPHLLPPESLHATLSSIELLSAMWSGTDELHLSAADESAIKHIAEYLQLELQSLGDQRSVAVRDAIPEQVVLGLKIRSDPGGCAEMGEAKQGVWVNVEFRLRSSGREGVRMWTSGKDAPAWLDRARVEEVNAILSCASQTEQQVGQEQEEGEEDTVGQILNAIEQVSELLLSIPSNHAAASNADTAATPTPGHMPSSQPVDDDDDGGDGDRVGPLVLRTWYYLPSLSTKSKRADIVSLATTHSPPLTGFLLAGKPGLIVLEHPLPASSSSSNPTAIALTASHNLSSFWSTIKTTSWSDIPASHKKISEKLTQPSEPQAFTSFDDVTDWPEVERGADRGRKSDLSKVIAWLDGKGIKGKWCLERCLGVGGWQT